MVDMSIENYSVPLLEYATTDLKLIFGNKNKVCHGTFAIIFIAAIT